MKALLGSWLDLIYPPLCLHCGASSPNSLFCSLCQTELTLLDPTGRCLYCFREVEREKLALCQGCKRRSPILHRLAAACEVMGPAAALLKKMKSRQQPALFQGAGALMAAQFVTLEWPFPDLIVPVPQTLTRFLMRGFNQSELLAQAVASILKRPVKKLLKRYSGDLPQSALRYEERARLSADSFALKQEWLIAGKTLLLIDDSVATGATLRQCGQLLLEEGAKAVYGLVFCQEM